MKAFNKWCCLALLIATIPISSAQQQERGRFAQREGYEQADFGSQVLTIKTASGTRSLRVSIAKLRVVENRKTASIRLPSEGTALVQHAAGRAHVSVAGERFDPFEGEWLRFALPADLRIGVDDDSGLLDLIVVEEAK
jgi:hypothetical protein